MRVRPLAAAFGAAVMLCTAAPARADVEELGRTQYVLFPGGEATSWEPPSSPNPNQTWIVGVSQPAGVSTTSLTYGDRALTLERAVTGSATRTEFWSLTNPEQVSGRLFRLVNSAVASPRVSLFRYAGVDTTAPVLGTEVSQGSGPGGQTALTGSGTPSDVQIGLFTHANGATSTGLGFTTPDGAAALGTWNLFSATPMRVAGITRRGPQQGVTGGVNFSWTVGNALDNNWSAAMIGLRAAPSTPTLGPVSVTTPLVGLANVTNTVTGDGRGGAVTARGFVLCQGCPAPTLGAAGSTDFPTGTGLGTITSLLTTLARGTAYTVRAYATNAQGRRYSAAVSFTTLANTAPTASAGGPYSVTEGAALTLAGTGSDADGDAVTFAWDLDNDGDYDDATGAAPALNATRMRDLGLDNGPLTRQVRVRVGDGFTNTTAAATLTVNNANPTGALAGQSVAEGATATIGLTGVTDPSAGDVTAGLRYAYDFQADGTYDVGSTTYAQASTATTANLPAALTADGPATRSVRVAVVDRDGSFTPYDATVTVTNVAPSATLSNSGPIDENATVQVSFAGVTDPSPTDAAAGTRYGYDFGNDGTYEIGSGTYATASPLAAVDVPAALTADNGTVAVRAVVIDKDGGLRPYTTTVTVNNVAPTATLTGDTVDEGETATVAFSAQADPSAGDTAAGFTYEYDLDGDGTFELGGASVTLPTTDGPATIAVKGAISDRDGGRREYDATVTVDNVAPTATVTGPDAVPSSGAVTLQVGASDPGGDPVSGTIDWGDGAVEPLTLGAVTHTYAAPGAYTVTVRARDADGGDAAPVTHALTVAAAPAAPTPTRTPSPTPVPVTPAAAKLAIDGLQVTPRCIRAANLRALTAQRRTVSVRFNLSAAADVRLSLERSKGKRGAKRCPAPTGKAKADGRKIAGVYSPRSNRAVAARAGANTVTLAATGRRGTLLRPGTYLLTVRTGEASARVKVWVLAG